MAPDGPDTHPGQGASAPGDVPGSASAQRADGALESLLGLSRAERPRPRRLALAAASLVLMGAVLVWLLPRALDLRPGQILDALSAVPAPVLVAALVLGALAVLLEGVAARAALPGAPWGATLGAQAAAGATALVVPGGSLLGLALLGSVLRRRGLALRTIAAGVAAHSVVDLLLGGVAIPLAALVSYGVLAGGHDLPGSTGAVVLGGIGALLTAALLALLLHRPTTVRLLAALEPTLRMVLDLLGRTGVPERTASGDGQDDTGPAALVLAVRDRVIAILRRRWAGILVPLLLARAAQCAVLWIAADALLDAAGTSDGIGPGALLGIFLIGRALSLVPVTPGGGGITETAVALLLTALGATAPAAAATSLVLGAATWAVPVVLGAVLGLALLARRRR